MPLPPEPFRPRRLAPARPYWNPGPVVVSSFFLLPITISLCKQTAIGQLPERFYYVTEGTCSSPLLLQINPIFLDSVLLILLLSSLPPQRLRPDLFYMPPLQPQNPVAAPRK